MEQSVGTASTQQQPATAKNFFLYFLTFALLYTVAINFGGILFDFINKLLPQMGEYGAGQFSASALRIHLASLIIGTPIFLWLAAKTQGEARESELVRHSGIRRWLTYITLIIAALIVIGDLISLVYSLLGGETTLRFILKSLVVLIISASIFYYYLTDIKQLKAGTAATVAGMSLSQFYARAAAVLVLASIIGGFFMIESPLTQRLRKQDQARLNNLQEIESIIYNYMQINQALPVALADLELREGVANDPITSQAFEYRPIDADTFELCATFETSNKEKDAEYYYGPDWLHDVGRTCFTRRVPDYVKSPVGGTIPTDRPAEVFVR